MKIKLFCIFLSLCMVIGCSFPTKPGFPRQSISKKAVIKSIEENFDLAQEIQNFFTITDKKLQRDKRNEILTKMGCIIDLNYDLYLERITTNKQSMDTFSDIAKIGLDLAIPLVPIEASKNLLSVISAGVSGTNLTINKNYFHERQIHSLMTIMNVARKEVQFEILLNMKKSIDCYGLMETITDLNRYYFSGTLLGAYEYIEINIGEANKKIAEEIQLIKEGE